jgi:quinol monooxygenase YgiN
MPPRKRCFPSSVESQHLPAMTTISKSNRLVTLINVFTGTPDHQQEVVDLLTHATETSVRHAPGFISSSLHRSLDGTNVVMYAQWRSIEDYEAMRKNPAPLPYLQQALALAKFEPGMYDVVETFPPVTKHRPLRNIRPKRLPQ